MQMVSTYIELDSLYFMILCLFEGKQSVLWQETAPVAGDDKRVVLSPEEVLV